MAPPHYEAYVLTNLASLCEDVAMGDARSALIELLSLMRSFPRLMAWLLEKLRHCHANIIELMQSAIMGVIRSY
ncbi:MAG: hypothetical protein ACTSXJ_05010 [Candidatus Baldrarchaeia archaeon]